MTVCSAARSTATCRHIRWVCGKPCSSTIGLPEPPVATLRPTPSVTSTRCWVKPGMAGVVMPPPSAAPISSRSAGAQRRPARCAGCRSVTGEMVVFGVLGPLQAEDGGRLLDLRGPRHRELLARLLVARGRVVSVTRLVDDLWDDPPEGAVGAVQTFVGALRRALEPDRPPRPPARLLVTAAPGYALRVRPEDTDAGRFEAAVGSAGALLAAGRAAEAHAVLDDALALWRGAAYAQV